MEAGAKEFKAQNGPLLHAIVASPSSTTPSCAHHFALNAFLCRFHLAPSPDCPLCLVYETCYLISCATSDSTRLNLIRRRLRPAQLSLCLLVAAKSDPKSVLTFVGISSAIPVTPSRPSPHPLLLLLSLSHSSLITLCLLHIKLPCHKFMLSAPVQWRLSPASSHRNEKALVSDSHG
ncbi:hypothetical protein B0H19DRAFT_1260878 [Mycena capillaripes]|nr:hypothetical protein B0H19DRAFT_1260878 [Mycena capillaripes]